MKFLIAFLLMVGQLAIAAEKPGYWFNVKSKDKFGVEKEYFTGYIPSKRDPRAQVRDFGMKNTVDPLPKEYYLPVVRIRRQQCGDCWAQGNITAFETTVAWLDKVTPFFSVQHIIDCSGFGGCGGGQLSMEADAKGAVYESEYPYKGYNQKCQGGLSYHEKPQNVFYLKDVTLPSLMRAVYETGAIEVCGAASSLQNGGWVLRNINASVNHCYAMVGWKDGALNGKPAGTYPIFRNSWGGDWGINGEAYVLYAKDGVHPDGDVVVEAQGIVYKPSCSNPPIADAGPEKSILLEEK